MRSDGSVIIDTRVDTKGFGKGVSNMQNQFSKMGNAVKKIGFAIAAVFSVREIINFAKEAIELGSDLQEVQNVVDVTFGEMSGYINQFAKEAITQFGLSELAAKQYASTLGAIFKSTGFDTAAALEMSQVITGLTGDIASFYNLTNEEAFGKLRAGITGETEPLKQLGINLSVANLEAYALSQGITKTYDAMSEQEKMLLRYNYILSVTSDAQGDFARTSNSWANQTRILKEQFNSLKATIGQGLINALTPVIQVINTILIGLQKVANAFLQFTQLLFGSGGAVQSAESIANSYGAAAESADSMAASTAAGGKAAKKYLSGLDEITTFGSDSGGGGGGGGGGGSDIFADFDLGKNLGDSATMSDGVSAFVQNLAESVKAGDWKAVGNAIAQKVNEAFEKIDGKKIAKTLSTTIRGALQGGTGFLQGLDGRKLGNEIGEFFVNLDWGGIIHDVIEFVGSAYDLAKELVAGIFEPMGDELRVYLVDTFTEDGELTGESFLEGLRTSFTDIGTWFRVNIFNPIDEAFGKDFLLGGVGGCGWSFNIGNQINGGLLGALSNLPGRAGEIFGNLRKRLVSESGQIELSLSDVWEAIKKGAIGGFAGIPDGIVGVFSTLKMKLQYAINNYIILPFNMLLKKIIDGVNGVFDGIENIGSALGLGKYINIGNVRMVSIPYLAQGAVIPPNAPFAAVLGDQKSGRNLEAPESLIRQIIREEMGTGSGGGVFHIVAQINGQTLFEQMIEEAELRQAATGTDPFALA